MNDPALTTLTAEAYTIPTDAPEADGTFAWDSTTMILVRARAADATGVGWTYGPAACAAVVTDLLAPVAVGHPGMNVAGMHEAMVRALRNAGRPGIAACALSAVDVALWDLKARLLAVPLHRLLGYVHDQIPIYGSGGFTTYDAAQLETQLSHWVHDQKIPRVKIKIGESRGQRPGRDLDRMRQARDIVGDHADLFVDANGGYTCAQAIRMMDDGADCDIRWFEEPVSSDDLDGLRQVRSAVRADVTAGEYGYDLSYFQRMCAAGAVDCLQADVSRCGGITEWLRIAAVAAAHGLQLSGHCAPHLHVHVAAATPNLRHLEWFHDHVRIESMCFDGTLDPTGGALHPDDSAPGHGLTPRTPDLDRYRVR